MNVLDTRMLYAPTLRYGLLSTALVDEIVTLAREIQADEAKAGGQIDFLNHQDPNAIAWAGLHGAELLEIDGQSHALGMGWRVLIRDALAEAIRQKMTDKQVADLVRFRFGYSEADASVIARTEIRLALGYGSYCGAVSVGMTRKRWLLSNDDGVCEGCRANAECGWLQIDAPFPSGALAAVDHVGCRCDTAYTAKPGRDAAKRKL